jgi:hypothetical protein
LGCWRRLLIEEALVDEDVALHVLDARPSQLLRHRPEVLGGEGRIAVAAKDERAGDGAAADGAGEGGLEAMVGVKRR